MPKIIAFLAIFIASTVLFNNAAQAKFYFGEKQDVVELQNLRFTNKKQEDLFLGRLVTTKFFLLGIGIKDEGYVLGVKGPEGKYYPFPPEARVAKMQASGALPKPMPTYELGFFDYLIGYSLYWVLGVFAIMFGWRVYSRYG